MGKSSRRNRFKIGKTAQQPVSDLNSALFADDTKVDTLGRALPPARGADMPAEFPGWQSHGDAGSFFQEQCGWRFVANVPEFSSFKLRDALQDRLDAMRGRLWAHKHRRKLHVEVIDRTAAVPLGPGASHAELPRVLAELMQETSEDSSKLFVILRNAHNTPAFLGGLWTWWCEEQGSQEAAREYLRTLASPTPGVITVHNASFNVIPSFSLQGGVRMAVGQMSSLLNDDANEFVCTLCSGPFVVCGETAAGGLHTALGAACGHPYHGFCLMKLYDEKVFECGACHSSFPVSIIPARYRGAAADDAALPVEELEQMSVRA